MERFDPAADRAAMCSCYDLYLAGLPADDPNGPAVSERTFAAWLEWGWTEDHPQSWLARDPAGRVCGFYSLGLPSRENTHLAYLTPLVGPAHRRQGIGAALVRHGAALARQRGRTLLSGDTRQGSPGEGFCLALGARPGITEVARVLRVDSIPDGHLARLRARAQAASAGYSLVSWHGPVPERYLEQMARLNQAAGDAPRDPGHEEQLWDAAQVRESEQRVAVQGLRYYTVAAYWERTGELAGMTQLGVDPLTPRQAYQELTVVARPHRGHQLGLAVKVAMLELLASREPDLEQIFTGNADTNAHMVAINAELGFEVIDRWLSWELAVADVLPRPVAVQS
jgi:RimJ/RimL family protein N-acetyltransferase